jgi:hypothetical protein
MSNQNTPRSFKPMNVKNADMNAYLVDTSQATKIGDVLRLNTTGKVRATSAGTALKVAGIQASNIFSKAGAVRDTSNSEKAVAGDYVYVWDDPNMVFNGQISTYTVTDPYTTRVGSACYDEAGSAGVQYVASSLSTLDTFKVLGPTNDYVNGERSTTGTYAKVRLQFNPNKHFRGVNGVTT